MSDAGEQPLEPTTAAAARPIPASIPMPDHEVRQQRWFQLIERLWRPATAWIACPCSVGYACIVAPYTGRPLSDGYLVQVLMFAAAVYGVKTIEKIRGVA